VRTDLPWRLLAHRHHFTPPVPDYVGGFALIAALVQRVAYYNLLEPHVQELPEIYGWPGAIWDLFSYPYLLLSIRAGLQGIDPAMEEAARSLGHGRRATFFDYSPQPSL